MPPPSSPLRRSPGLELRNDSHRRGHSLESGLPFKERDDDLALFNEMQNKETENFLLQASDDFEDILSSREQAFPDLKLGISIPARGENSELLDADGDKNDYDWLLTPPETPLFPSLEDEPEYVNAVHGGRDRSRPISISRSSTMERSHRSSRGSPSPQRSSPSPRSGSSTIRGRPSSAPHASPISLRPSTPSRRSSPPPLKPSTPPPRSSTPTSRRTSVGPGVSSGLRGTSAARTSRGNSASPKIKAWQSAIPGFSLESPPNLCTSLADHPASYVRGSSPASRTSRDSSSKPGRQSMSPTASRNISSSHSQERDRLSSYCRGSLASSGDDDADSLQSIPVSVSESPMSRRGVGGVPNSKPVIFSNKPGKAFSPSSAPKRSFDSAMRQMEWKNPRSMFRPLLSSVPSSNFYAGKTDVTHHTIMSRNSSVATSSNTSSDPTTGGAHDNEGTALYQDDMVSDCTKASFSDIQDEVFGFDKLDVATEAAGFKAHRPFSKVQLDEPDESGALACHTGDSKESKFHICALTSGAACDIAHRDLVETDSDQNMLLCSRCGCQYHVYELIETEHNICPECKQKEEFLANPAPLIKLETPPYPSARLLDTSEESKVTECIPSVPLSQFTVGIVDLNNFSETAFHEEHTLEVQVHDSLSRPNHLDISSPKTREENVQMLSEQLVAADHEAAYNPSHAPTGLEEMHKSLDKPDPNVDVVEGAGISVLLKRSSSAKGPLIHSRAFNSSAISYDELSFSRDFTSSMRSSTGHGSMSTSSSIDLASARHGEMLMQRLLSSRRLSDTSSKPQSTVSSFSGTSMQVSQGFGASTSSHEETYEGSVSNLRHTVAGETPGSPLDQVLALENAGLHDPAPAQSEEANGEVYFSSIEKDALVMPGDTEEYGLDNSLASIGIDEGCVLYEATEDLQKNDESVQNVPELGFLESPLAEESVEVKDPLQCSLATVSEIEIDDSHPSSPGSQIDMASREDVEIPSSVTCPDKDVKVSDNESIPTCGDVEESTVMVEEQRGRRARSMTLEEATDTILFCNSIIHELAYKAASIAIGKEEGNLEPLECSWPTVTIPEKQSSNRNSISDIGTGRTTKTRKAKKRRAETEVNPPLTKNDEKSVEPVVRNVGLPNNDDNTKPLKLESKCNCTIM